jgi:hypothetical protein
MALMLWRDGMLMMMLTFMMMMMMLGASNPVSAA